MFRYRKPTIAMIGAAGVLLTVCGAAIPSTTSARNSTVHGKPITVGVSMYSLTNPYFAAMKQSFIQHGKKYGIKVEVEASNDDQATQLAQIESFIQQHVAAVAIVPYDSSSIVTAVQALNRAHIPVFFVDANANMAVMNRDHAHEVEVVESNNRTGGVTVGREMVKFFGPKAHIQIGMINFPTASSTQLRDAGFLSVIHRYPGYQVVSTLNGNVSPVTGLQVATEMIEAHPQMRAIFSDTGPAALGALQAIKSLKKVGKIDLFGFSSARQNIVAVEQNSIYKAGAMQQPKVEAAVESRNIWLYLHHHPVPKQVLIPVLPVTKQNAKAMLPLSFGKL
jgi:ribose transport system substrate-binding protein